MARSAKTGSVVDEVELWRAAPPLARALRAITRSGTAPRSLRKGYWVLNLPAHFRKPAIRPLTRHVPRAAAMRAAAFQRAAAVA
eukprot:6156074-Prymnesium_polylepis.1